MALRLASAATGMAMAIRLAKGARARCSSPARGLRRRQRHVKPITGPAPFAAACRLVGMKWIRSDGVFDLVDSDDQTRYLFRTSDFSKSISLSWTSAPSDATIGSKCCADITAPPPRH